MKSEESYISKKEAKKRGYVKRAEGGYYKKSVLERYFDDGYLHLSNSPYSDEDRMRAGMRLAKDYYLGNYDTLQSKRWYLIKICSSGESNRDRALYYNERYINASKSIPFEFWHVVRQVCIEDKEPEIDRFIKPKSLLSKQNSYHQKMLLSLGLERLIEYYSQKDKKKS